MDGKIQWTTKRARENPIQLRFELENCQESPSGIKTCLFCSSPNSVTVPLSHFKGVKNKEIKCVIWQR